VCKGAVVGPTLEATPRGAALLQSLQDAGVVVEHLSDEQLDEVAATEQPQGIVAVYQPRHWTLDAMIAAPKKPVVILDGVQDPGNVGTIARTALAFGAAGIVALPGTVDLTNPKVVRAAMGALFLVPHLHADDVATFAWLKQHHVAPWATSMDGEPLGAAPAGPIALLLGNEGAGLRPELVVHAEKRVAIPIAPEAESLNVAIAAGILLYQVTR
jgi:TrmH family RNA methyltransferase